MNFMNKISKRNILGVVTLCLVFPWAWAQEEEKTLYSNSPNSFRRLATASQDKKEGVFLPTYSELASDPEKGVTLEDWQKYFLSEARFYALGANPNDNTLSRQALAGDNLQGETQLLEQGSTLIEQCCKDIPNYRVKLRQLKKSYPELDQPVKYIVDKQAKLTGREFCTYPGCGEVRTKTYIQARHGRAFTKHVCLGHYALFLLQDYDRDSSVTPYIVGVILVGLIVAATILIPVIISKK